MKIRRITAILASIHCACAFAADAPSAILFVGDGMGQAAVTAARIYQGNARDGKLALDEFDQVAIVRTFCSNTMVTDSAASATAFATGHKTNALMIGQDPGGNTLETILEKAKKAGKSVGVVTTTTVTHATPACFYAHIGSRALESNIADQLIDYGQVDVVMGGGREFFLPKGTADPETGGTSKRMDGRDLIAEAKAKGYRYIQNQAEFDETMTLVSGGGDPGKVLALFQPGMMNYDVQRANDTWGEPSLAEMTELAIKVLSRNPRGYFLMVEGGRIDHGSHANQAKLTITDLIAFDKAVQAGLDLTANAKETLVVVTADHETGGLAINGYAGIEISGDALFTTEAPGGAKDIITFGTGPGQDREAMKDVPRDSPDYKQPSVYKMGSAAHSGVDVHAWAAGPGAEAFKGTIDNTEIALNMMKSLGLE